MQKLLFQTAFFKVTIPSVVFSTALLTATWIGTADGGDTEKSNKKWANREAKEKLPAKEFVLKQELTATPGGTLILEADRGSIEVVPLEAQHVSVEVVRSIRGKYVKDAEAVLKHHDVQISEDGNNTVVRSRLKLPASHEVAIDGLGFDASEDIQQAMRNAIRKRLKDIRFRIKVPSRYNVRLKTGGQSITCGDLDGQAYCSTSGGGIKLGRITGLVHASASGGSLHLTSAGDSVELRTSGGSIRAGDIQGDAVVSTSGGSISLGRVQGRASAKTSGGSIHIVDAGGAVEAVTSGGSVNAAISQQPKADSYFSTSGGSVNVAFAKELAFDVEHLGRGKASGPFLKKPAGQGLLAKLNGGGPKLITKGNVRFAYLNQK